MSNAIITSHEFVPIDGNENHCAFVQCGFPRSDHARVPATPVGEPRVAPSLLDGRPVLAQEMSDGGLRESPIKGDDSVLAFEVAQTWLSLLNESARASVESAFNAVVRRMHGCAEPNCSACRHNRETVYELIVAVRNAAQTPGTIVYKLSRDADGEADAFVIAPHKALHRLAPRNDVRNHSPDGFEWGYHGSGPAQLALALCIHALGGNVSRAERVYQQYKSRVLANIFAADYTLTQPEVVAVIEAIEQEMGYATKDEANSAVES